jgi:hypothetical protein
LGGFILFNVIGTREPRHFQTHFSLKVYCMHARTGYCTSTVHRRYHVLVPCRIMYHNCIKGKIIKTFIPHLQTKHNQSYHYKPKQMESMSSPTFYINKDGVGRYADDNADDEHSATAIVTKTATQTPNPPKAASDEDTVKES